MTLQICMNFGPAEGKDTFLGCKKEKKRNSETKYNKSNWLINITQIAAKLFAGVAQGFPFNRIPTYFMLQLSSIIRWNFCCKFLRWHSFNFRDGFGHFNNSLDTNILFFSFNFCAGNVKWKSLSETPQFIVESAALASAIGLY